MKQLLQLTLGIMTALGGFVDLGQIVFTMQAGALFGYGLVWSIVLGTVAIIVYMEMSGRIAAVAHKPVFVVVREACGQRVGLFTLVGSNLLNLLTCAAEVGAIGIVLHLLTGLNERFCALAGVATLGVIVWLLKFQWIERTFGLAGLTMTVFAAAAWKVKPDWQALWQGLIPQARTGGSDMALYAYFAVGIFSALLMEYEVHFYSSGAIEEKWSSDDLADNTFVATAGTLLGSLLTCALMVLGAEVFRPTAIFPADLSVTLMPAALPFGPAALRLALFGVLACVASAAIETAMSGAYNYCQFYRLPWGKNRPPLKVPVFTGWWVAMFAIAAGIAVSGIRPLTLVNISIVFGMVIMPLTYYPVLRVSADSKVMGTHRTRGLSLVAGWAFLALIVVAALAALPLMIITHSGQPN